MTDAVDEDFKGANEIGKIFNSFMDKKLLCDFFLDSVLTFISARSGFLYLVGSSEQLFLESHTADDVPSPQIQSRLQAIYHKGQPVAERNVLYIPLIVRNRAIGIAVFLKPSEDESYSEKEFSLAMDLTYQMAGALQNILLFEENLKMERLAAIGQTTSMVMHELTNILQLAKLADECLRRGLDGKNEKFLQKGLQGLHKALKEMDGFAYEMLSLTKNYKIRPVKMNLPNLVKELEHDLEDKARQAKVKLDFQAEEALEVDGEPRSLYRALLNLVKNAIEASDKDEAFIQIRARSLDSYDYEIKIEDNGQGMPEEVKAQIFQAFFTTKGEKGTGLGLMIIDRTIKAHQGKIQVESERGKGTTFVLTFPKLLPTE